MLGDFWFGLLQVKQPPKRVIKWLNKKQWLQLFKRKILPFILQAALPTTATGPAGSCLCHADGVPKHGVPSRFILITHNSFRCPSCESEARTYQLMSLVFLPLPQLLSRDTQPPAEDSADCAYGGAAGRPEWESKAWYALSPCNSH